MLKHLSGLARQVLSATRTLSIVALFTSLIISSDYAMASIPNVKLLDTLVFASAYSFGFKIGAYIAVLSELIWGLVSPWGGPSYIVPFLIVGELIYAFAGWGASRIWGNQLKNFSREGIYFGAIISICAFLWDTFTNFGTALPFIWNHLTFAAFIPFELFALWFMFNHEVGDLVLGSIFAPLAINYLTRIVPKLAGARGQKLDELQRV